MQDGYRDGGSQSESVSAPQRDESPPRRSRSAPIAIVVLLLVLVALGTALVIAAFRAS